ncbi:hypothetical protein L0U85_00305 [Glycomyces sp. L485]|uniref:hypothetical protein n=1 Tax=Glycomyces sp. L485 TaxID=2909235 RepID=UPI001F4A7F67|nr:hypothetical protein [Glycomyces sp. L485]MCH7229312.1 hypothetical protein [Glycomyces sp. L485]
MLGDPDATVEGVDYSGRINVLYGDGAVSLISEADIPELSVQDDAFGEVLDSTDWNGDGCADLFVGIPSHSANVSGAGAVVLIYGSPEGLDPSSAEIFHQGDGLVPGTEEVGDHFGAALAAGRDQYGEPFVLIGSPGESVGNATYSSGKITYMRPSIAVDIHEDVPGVGGENGSNDHFGEAVAASSGYFAIGNPTEWSSDVAASGTVHVFEHGATPGTYSVVGNYSQGVGGLSDTAEVNDRFGAVLAMADYAPSGAESGASAVLAVGAEYEDVGEVVNAGIVHVLEVGPNGVEEEAAFHQDTAGVSEVAERHDNFSSSLAFVDQDGAVPTTWSEVALAVNTAGEDDGAGLIQVFPMSGAPGDNDVTIDAAALAGTTDVEPAELAGLGLPLHSANGSLYAGAWDWDGGIVFRIPSSSIAPGWTGEADLIRPGTFGVPADGMESLYFGYSIA